MSAKAMNDIIRWFHETDSADLPNIVTYDINVLPSVDVNNIDVSLLMHEISQMRHEFGKYKEMCDHVVRECTRTKHHTRDDANI